MGNRLPPVNVTKWYNRGQGYTKSSGSLGLTTQSGIQLETQSGIDLITNPNIFTNKSITTWTKATKNTTNWRPLGGHGYVVSQGVLDFVDNLGNFITDNLGNNIVTTPNYVVPKNVTVWKASGA